MHQIEIVGMRKNRDLKIVFTIIVLAIIGIMISIGVIMLNKIKLNQENELKEVSAEATNILVEQNVISHTGNSEDTNNKNQNQEFVNTISNIYNLNKTKTVYLTFDDGPTKEVTPYILDTLNKYNVKATFFVLGARIEMNPDILKREYNEGHYIANHGYSHKYSSIYKNAESVLDEYKRTENAIKNALGIDYSSNLFRFPGGSHGGPYEKIKKEARKKLNDNGIAFMDWSALTYDAEGAKTPEDIVKNLKNTINGWNNVVILMHDAADKKITYESLDDVIEYLQKEGYAFKNIYDIM